MRALRAGLDCVDGRRWAVHSLDAVKLAASGSLAT
jgi:hypothetical protein